MKIHNALLIILGLFFLFYLLFAIQNHTEARYNEQNTEYAQKLTSACYDAAKTIATVDMATTAGCFDESSSRLKALDAFYKSLSHNLNMDSEPRFRGIKDYTPFVLLVDNPGFYISYNGCFDEYGNSIVPDGYEEVNVLSELNTYTGTYGGHTVRYFLNDLVEVTLKNGTYYEGNRVEVYAKLSGSAKNSLSFLNDSDLFWQMRTEAVSGKIEQTINYLLNTQMINVDTYNTGYQVALPQLTGEDWSRMIIHPTVISFAQGIQEQRDNHLLNVYAYAAGEINTRYLYFILNGEYYCLDKKAQSKLTKQPTNHGICFLYDGQLLDGVYTSMEDCAATGAVPSTQIFTGN